ncbi:MAG TPA: type VI secretion system baseplate subunit TssG [Blastocatellia bacterium]|nr:type VI secretion system baseplate subunit TssG [Blastocatellia bacterium]
MKNKPLNEILADEAFRFDFFQAVRLFERLYPEKKPVGADALPNEEPIRFRSNVTLDYPASQISELREAAGADGEDTRRDMLINFMGMIGPSGVLPTHYTELVLDRIRHRDTAMWSFLDIFTHRSASMFYRAWAKYRFPIAYERGRDEFTSYLFDIAGIGTDRIRGKMSVEDESLLPYAGLIAQKPHSASAVENVIGDYFGVRARVAQFSGQWLDLNETDWSRLGKQKNALGKSTIAGTRIWDQFSKFRLNLGPLTFAQFQAFLPSGTGYAPLRSIVKFMTGIEFDFDVRMRLKAKQVPGAILTTKAVRKPQLGWTTWLKTKPFKKDDEQVLLQMV